MLREVHDATQPPGEPQRRSFQSPEQELVVWYAEGSIIGFQFCYDRNGARRALSWRQGEGFSHLVAQGRCDADSALDHFVSAAEALPAEIARFVVEKLIQYPGNMQAEPTANAGEGNKDRVAAATRYIVNLLVLRELRRLLRQWKAQEHFRGRARKFFLPVIVVAFAAAAGFALWMVAERREAARALACDQGTEAARQGRHDSAITLVTQCLAASSVLSEKRAYAFKVRAWSHSRLAQAALAVQDQEAAFSLVPASDYRDFLHYALYLRDAGRSADSLQALLAAESAEGGRVSMMTQYHKGWTLQELGRNREAVEAFSKGIRVQPSYAFVYWRRGLAYEDLGEKKLAAQDFEQCARLLAAGKVTQAGKDLFPDIRAKLRDYGLQDKYPL
jgi:tetratricopeptide (TPR) repeat protein